jgi:hypothetical protein
MGTWRDQITGKFKFKFQYKKRDYGGGGYKTKRDAVIACEKRRKEVTSPKPPPGMALSTVVLRYCDHAERKFAKQTYFYKKSVYEQFLQLIGDIDVTQIQPAHIESYLQTRPSNNSYNVHRKELSALFNYGIKTLRLGISKPCNDLDKMPHTPNGTCQ